MNKYFQIILSLFIAAALVTLIFVFTDPVELWNKVKMADPFWISISVIISLLSHLSRARRWVLLMQPFGHNPPLANSFMAVMTAYFGNIFIPRGGEVMRCVVLNRSHRVPMSTSLATVVAERVIDLLCLAILVALSFIMEFDRFLLLIQNAMKKQGDEPGLLELYYPWIIASGVVFVVAAVVFRNHSIFKKGRDFVIKLFTEAYLSFIKLEKKKEFLFHTVFIWLAYYLMTYLVFFSLPFTSGLGPLAGLVILNAGAIGMSVPASGGFGSFHYFVGLGLSLFYGVKFDDGVAYAYVLHSTGFIQTIIVGGLAAFISFYVIGRNALPKNNQTAT